MLSRRDIGWMLTLISALILVDADKVAGHFAVTPAAIGLIGLAGAIIGATLQWIVAKR